MSMFDHAPASALAGREPITSKFRPARILALLMAQYRALRGRVTVMDMRDFNDAQLADIGLRRSDVDDALKSPLGVDPSRQLMRSRRDPLRGLRRA